MKQKLLIIAGVVALAVIAMLAFSGSNKVTAPSPEGATTGTQQPAPTGQNQATAPTGAQPSGATAPKPPAPASPKTISINITNPAGGDNWEVGKVHTIKWSAAAGVTGSLELLNAATGASAGWILSQTAAGQTSYDWDTKQVWISRNSALGKEVSSGKYMIRLAFDSKSFVSAKSASFSIVYPGQIQAAVHNVSLQSYAFSPKSLTVKQGDKVIFTNFDSVTHTVVFQAMSPASLAPGATYTLETGIFSPGTYNYYCNIHPSMTGTLIVQ